MRARGRRAEVVAGVSDATLAGRTAVVTGATSGIGREVALALGRLGADVHVHGRDPARGRAVLDELEAAGVAGRFHRADFTDIDAVNEFGGTLADTIDAVDILVHNAGAHFRRGESTAFGLERTFQVNQFAPFLVTEHLRPLHDDARVVVVASEVHRRGSLDGAVTPATRVEPYDGFQAYADSKLANVCWARALANRTGAAVNACHPGFVPSSRLWRDSPRAIRALMRVASITPHVLVNRVVDTPVQAAATPVFLAASDEGGRVDGRYYVDCQQREPSPQARDSELVEALWSWSTAQLNRPTDTG